MALLRGLSVTKRTLNGQNGSLVGTHRFYNHPKLFQMKPCSLVRVHSDGAGAAVATRSEVMLMLRQHIEDPPVAYLELIIFIL